MVGQDVRGITLEMLSHGFEIAVDEQKGFLHGIHHRFSRTCG
jgi:hypothetical protein